MIKVPDIVKKLISKKRRGISESFIISINPFQTNVPYLCRLENRKPLV